MAFIGVPVLLLVVSVLSGFASDVGSAITCRLTLQASNEYTGALSLEETILLSDVIAVVDLDSVGRGVDAWKFDTEVVYSKSLRYGFQVEEYLMGSGEDLIVGLVFGLDCPFNTALGAHLGTDPDPERKERWDDRKAVVFLRDDAKDPRVRRARNSYYLGLAEGRDERYSVGNSQYRAWLPAASSSDDEQRFLLESDRGTSSPETITLDELKTLISVLQKEMGEGQTDEYKQCVLSKYSAERIYRYLEETRGISSQTDWVPCRERFS